MSKTRVTWGFQEVIASAKLNEANTDWIRKGQLIMSTMGAVDETVNGGAAAVRFTSPTILCPWVYNSAKQVADRMRVMGILRWDTSAAGAPVWAVQYNIGGGWVAAPLVTAIPAGVQPSPPYTGGGAVGPGYTDIDISAVAATQWFSWRIILTGGAMGANTWVSWALSAYLFNSVDTPH